MSEAGSSEGRSSEAARPTAVVRRLDLVRAMIGQGLPVRMRVQGLSMRPFIRDDDIVTIAPLQGRDPSVGEVVAFAAPDSGTLAIHRVVSRGDTGWLLRGDNRRENDGIVAAHHLLGVVTRVERGGRDVAFGSGIAGAGMAWFSRKGALVGAGAVARSFGRLGSGSLTRVQRLAAYRRAGRRLRVGIEVEESSPAEIETFRRRACAGQYTPQQLPLSSRTVGIWVARRRGRVVGFAELVDVVEAGSPWSGMWLSAFVVRVPYRGLGVGEALVSRALARASSLGGSRLSAAVLDKNRPAIDLLRKAGFHTVSADALIPVLEAEADLVGGRPLLLRRPVLGWAADGSLSPEIRALLACARAVIDPKHRPEFRTALAKCPDAPRLCEAAVAHGMLGHLHRLVAADGRPVDRLEELQRLASQRCLRQSAQLLRVLGQLHDESIEALAFKGPVSAQQLYADVTLRTWEDLDLAVRHEQIPALREVLLAEGFVDANPFNGRMLARKRRGWGEIALKSDKAGVYLDVHWNVAIAFSGGSLPAEQLMDRAGKADILGQEVRAPAAADTLLISTINGTKDRWNSVEGLLGLGVQVSRWAPEEWTELLSAARLAGCYRRTVVGIAHVCRVLGLEAPTEVIRALDHDGMVRMLLSHLSPRSLDRGLGPLDARGELERIGWRLSTGDSLAAGIWHAAARFFVPGPEDWEWYSAPRGLSWSYGVLRPLRLAAKWARRL